MARRCEVCGKDRQIGNQVTTRGKAKYLGGVGTKITGITRREFRPNLQRVRVTTQNGTHARLTVCTQCMRSGAITRQIRSAPFQLPADAAKKAASQNAAAAGEKPAKAKRTKKKSEAAK